MPVTPVGPNRVSTTTPTSSPPSQVTVAAGDSLSKLAARMGVTVDALVEANQTKYPSLATNRNTVKIGWTLTAPGAAPSSTPAAVSGWGPSTSTSTTSRPQAAGSTGGVGNSFGATLAAAGAQSIELRMKAHNDSIDKTGVGVYFGDHSGWKTMSAEEKAQWIKDNAKPGTTPPPASSIKENSCIGWAMENVGAAYKAAGKADRWAEIQHLVVSKGSKGMDLAKELKKDGWQSVYWNPDTAHPDDGNAEHSFSALQVARGKGYYGVDVDAQVINYRPTEGQGTRLDTSGLDKLKQVPFFFGLAKGGVHTFVGRQGEVNEFHWSDMPDSHDAIQQTPLQKWGWNSGLIMVPPGTWPKS